MASHAYDRKSGKARLFLRYAGRQYNRTIRVASEREAERACAIIEETIQDLNRGRLAMPPGADPFDFLLTGGKVTSRPEITVSPPKGPDRPPTLKRLFETYAETLTPGSKESNSLSTEAVHRKHFLRVLGEGSPLDSLSFETIQGYVDTRARDGIGRETIHKELSTFRVIWNWAFKRKHVGVPLGWKMTDLTMPKTKERPPFQTWAQISRKIERGGLSEADRSELWECLWLDQGQAMECLAWVEANATHPFLHPMFAFAAFTGARRSEMLRSERDDWDFEAGVVSIRQKKADKSRTFTRRTVQIHPALAAIMGAWFSRQSESHWTICAVDGSPIGPSMSTKLFRSTLAGGRWSVLHGWHTFRHSLASIMASDGADQRVINDILGHHTVEMERRYRHLLPQKQAHALNRLFQSAG